jgi:hypothetical protein
MKRFFLLVSMAVSLCGYNQTGKQSIAIPKPAKGLEVPAEVLTNDSTYWTISTLSNIGYVNTTPGAYYNSYKSGGGMMVKFKFRKNNRFEFQLYVQANTYGTDTETWTQVEGSVEFTTDAKGQPVFITRADKGTYRTVKNGRTTSRPIPEAELKGQHSCTYLWEKTTFGDDPNHIYLLMVDMEAHPGADINTPGSIDPSWVSKFHIPKK